MAERSETTGINSETIVALPQERQKTAPPWIEALFNAIHRLWAMVSMSILPEFSTTWIIKYKRLGGGWRR
jgi:hypothetical protein